MLRSASDGQEPVNFRITTTGDIEHEFVLGDEQDQQMADEMGEGDRMPLRGVVQRRDDPPRRGG